MVAYLLWWFAKVHVTFNFFTVANDSFKFKEPDDYGLFFSEW